MVGLISLQKVFPINGHSKGGDDYKQGFITSYVDYFSRINHIDGSDKQSVIKKIFSVI